MTTCTDNYVPQAFRAPGDPAPTPIPCVRDVDEEGRHRGDHQGWEPMPAGSRETRTIVNGAWVTGTEEWGPWHRLWTWSAGGSSGSARKGPGYTCMGCRPDAHRRTHEPEDHGWQTCPSCGVTHDPHGYSRFGLPDDLAGVCFSCALWEDRARTYALDAPLQDTRRGMRGRWSRPVRPHGDTLAGSAPPRLYGWSHGHGGAFGGMHHTVTWDTGETDGPADFLWDSGAIPWWMLDRFPPNATVQRGGVVPRAGYTTGFNGRGTPLVYRGHP